MQPATETAADRTRHALKSKGDKKRYTAIAAIPFLATDPLEVISGYGSKWPSPRLLLRPCPHLCLPLPIFQVVRTPLCTPSARCTLPLPVWVPLQDGRSNLVTRESLSLTAAMEQTKTKTTTRTTYLARPRTSSLSIQVPTVKALTAITPAAMSYSHNHRPLSPGGRRIANSTSNRMSDQGLADSNYYPSSSSRHSANLYASPRNSAGVIPISTQTFINVPPPTSSRPVTQYDSYSGRPRRSSLVDTQRGTVASSTQQPSRRPTIIQNDQARPASPIKKEYYVTPASSQEPRVTHKKLYSVDDGGAKLVADVNIPGQASGERHHKRRDSVERSSNYRSTGVDRERERDQRGRRGYHVNGSHNRTRDKSIDDEDAYSYTDPASMYRDTEPKWREVRPRRGSMERGGATSRERPVSVLDPTFGMRQPAKEVGPPPSTRGWDKINENLGRTRSVRDEPPSRQHVAQSPTRGRAYAEPAATYSDPRDPYYVAPRTNSTDRRTTVHQYDYGYDEQPREIKRERKQSVTRDSRPDQSVERRGFGIRTDLRNEGHPRTDSQNRYARDGRGSDESFDGQKYRDSGYVEPHRRDTAPELYPHDVLRLEQEKKDRELALRSQAEERDRHRDREVRIDTRDKRRDDDRGVYDREQERDRERDREREKDREREREREREKERERERTRQPDPPADRERDRHHHRRDTDREHSKKDNSPRQSSDTVSKPSLSQAATGGLAGAAAAFGLTGLLNKVTDNKREKEREESKDRERERERERERKDRRKDDDRAERRKADDRTDRSPHRERRPGKASSDEEPRDRDAERDRYRDTNRGLGFAYEGPPELPKSAPLTNNHERESERSKDDRTQDKRGVDGAQDRVADRQPAQERVSERPERQATLDRAPERQATFDRAPERQYTQDRDGERQPQERDRQPPRDLERDRDYDKTAEMPAPAVDADEDYRRRMEQVQRELGVQREAMRGSDEHGSDSDRERTRRRREREQRQRERETRGGGAAALSAADSNSVELPSHVSSRRSFDRDDMASTVTGAGAATPVPQALRRRPSILDQPMSMNEPVQIIDNSMSEKRENRVRIVDPPTEEEERRPKSILKRPTPKFPEDPNNIREGVAPLKDVSFPARDSYQQANNHL
jgi:hypothetical protein